MLAALASAAPDVDPDAFGASGLSFLRLIGPGCVGASWRDLRGNFKPGRAAHALERLAGPGAALRETLAGRTLAAFCDVRPALLAVALNGVAEGVAEDAPLAAVPGELMHPDLVRALFGEAAAFAAWKAHNAHINEDDASPVADTVGRVAPLLRAAWGRLSTRDAPTAAYVLAPLAWAAAAQDWEATTSAAVAKELFSHFAALTTGVPEKSAIDEWVNAPRLPPLGEPLNAGVNVAEPAGRLAVLVGLQQEPQDAWYALPKWAAVEEASTP